MARIKRLRNKSEKEIMRAALRKGQVTGADWIKLFREYQLREQPDAKERLSLWELAVENKWLKDAALIQAIHEIRKLKNPPKAEKIPSAEEQSAIHAKQTEEALRRNQEFIDSWKRQEEKLKTEAEESAKPKQPKTRDPLAPKNYYYLDGLKIDVTDTVGPDGKLHIESDPAKDEMVEVIPTWTDYGWIYVPVAKV